MPEAYTVPFVATTNAIISSSDANVGYAGNIRYFRQFISNPASANLPLVSSSTDGAAFNTLPDAGMTNQKVNQVNPSYTGFAALTDKGSGFFDVAGTAGDAPEASHSGWMVIQNRHWNWGANYWFHFTAALDDATDIFCRTVIANTPSAWARVWTSANDGSGSGLDADLLDGHDTSFFATASGLATEISDRAAADSAAAHVPSGLGGFFATAAGIASGWTRYSAADGRMLVGAGTTFSVTYTENTAVGANWTPFAGAGGFTGTAADVVNVTVSGATSVSAASHQNSLSIPAQTWTPVARIIVWATKN